MTRDEGNRAHRHPDAVAYLEGLTEDEARVHPPLARAHDGGFTRYRVEGGEVRSRDVVGDGAPEALLEAVSAEFGPPLPRLAADLASGAPDLDAVERALRDASLGGGGAALRLLLERLDGTLPAPECGACGGPMARHGTGRRKAWLTRLGRVGVERSYFRCRSCGGGRFAPGRALGLEGGTVTPGMESVMAETAPLMSFEAAGRHVANLAGVRASPSSLRRWSLKLGEAAQRFEREEVLDGRPLEPRMYLSIDGTGIPMRKGETEGIRGRQADGTSKSREAKLAVIYTAGGRDPETGAALKDRGSESVSCLIDSAAAPSGGREPSAFAARLDREARRRGLHDADELVVVSDGAEWIRSACDEIFGGRKVTFVPDMFHALEYAADAVRAILPAGAERDRRFEGIKADIMAGRAARAVRELEPFSARHGEVAACCRYFRGNMERMRYDEYRARGIQVGSGVVEAGCRTFGLRLKRPGTRWSRRGANAMLALKGCVLNLRLPGPLDWRANQAVAA